MIKVLTALSSNSNNMKTFPIVAGTLQAAAMVAAAPQMAGDGTGCSSCPAGTSCAVMNYDIFYCEADSTVHSRGESVRARDEELANGLQACIDSGCVGTGTCVFDGADVQCVPIAGKPPPFSRRGEAAEVVGRCFNGTAAECGYTVIQGPDGPTLIPH
jgi:hypothetical protein